MNWLSVVHAVHILLAGLWVGGLAFTSAVVSPAFKRMEWTPAERIAVRSEVGRQYSKVARLNLATLLLAALADWLPAGLGTVAIVEIGLILLVVFLSQLHARYYAPRLAQAARAQSPDRAKLLRVSVGVSMLNLSLSVALVVLSSLRPL